MLRRDWRMPLDALRRAIAANNFAGRPWFSELGELIRLSLPIIVTMGSQTMMQFVDAFMVARYGPLELAAITPAGLTYFTLGSFMIGLTSCNNVFVSQALGKGELHECAHYTVHALYVAVFGQLLMVPLTIWAPGLFGLYGHEPAVQALEVTYFRALSYRLAASGMVISLSTYFQGTGRSVIPMITGISVNVINLVLDYLLIFGKFGFPRWGILGAGVATTIASYSEAALLLAYFLSRRENTRYGTRRWAPFQWQKIRQLLRIGIAAGFSYALDLGSWAIFIGGVVGRLGSTVLAANNAASQMMQLSFMPAIGLNTGVTALVGRYIGRGDIPGAKRRAYYGMACAAAYMTLMGILFVIFRHPLIRLFRPEPEIVRVGGIILTYVALFQFADAFGIVSAGALKGAGDTRFPAIAQVIAAWCFFLPIVFLMGNPNTWGIHGAWIAATIYIWIFDGILFWRFVGEKWRRINIFE